MKAGWTTRQLGEVCSFLNRGISPRYLDDGGICVLNQKCIRDHRVSYKQSRRHDAQAKKVGRDRLVRVGDVLVNSTGVGTLGRVAQVRENPTEPTTVDSHVTIVRPKSETFYLDFFGYMLVVIEDAITEAGEGCGGQTELARSVLAERFSVHYPESLPEQQRIVSILDKAFEGIATATAHAEKNIVNARALFDSYLTRVFTQRGEGWVEKPLGAVCSFENGDRGANYPSKSARTATGIPFINAGHLTGDGLALESMDYISRERFDLLGNGKISKGDILFCLRGSLGKFASVGDLSEGAIASSLVIVRPDNTVLNDFLLAYFRSPLCSEMINRFKNGAAQPNLSAHSLRKFIAPFPPLPEQESVVAKLAALHDETEHVATLYGRKLAALKALKRSLLHQAFAGQL
jgi:type I restriction enzyme S subunit